MKRKDILIIAAIVIVIAFGTVLGIYLSINGNIFEESVQKVEESFKKTHHSNGWETAIVDEIVDNVPVPVGFTYIEGKKKNGLIIENNISKEKYMWIPKTEEVNEDIYEEIMRKCNLGENNDSEVESITKYDGFYIAIDEMLEGETYEVKTLTEEEKYELRLRNESLGETVETHLTTSEEMASVLAYNEKIENKIKVTNYKTLTVLAETVGAGEKEESKTEEAATKHETEEAYIPAGFTHVEGTTVATGFKIEDSNNLRFIWIPVEDIENIANIKTQIIDKMKEAGIEEDTITAYESYKDDTESDEYTELKASIEKYGGFYISESELGYDKNGFFTNKTRITSKETGYVTNGDYYRNVTEGNISKNEDGTDTGLGTIQRDFNKNGGLTKEKAIEKCKEIYNDSETVVSHLGYGLNYDATILYLLNNCSKVTNETAFSDSTSIGKYSDSDQESLWYSENYLNGIYGLAGNVAEITQEQNGESIITVGGSFADAGNMNPIASRSISSKEELDLDGEGKKSGKVGFRAFLYIKETRVKNESLETAKKEAKKVLIDYINKKEVEHFNNKYNEDTKKYEIKILNDIVEYIGKRIDSTTSTASFNKIIQYGKEEVDRLIFAIEEIINYKEGYTYGEINDACWNVKKINIQSMDKLSWDIGKLTLKDGTPTTYNEIIVKNGNDIEIARNALRYIKKAEILDYPTGADKSYIEVIRANAEEEIYATEDLANIDNVVQKCKEIIEITNSFENVDTDPTTWTSHDNTWNYYESWKDTYNSLRNEGINEIAKTRTVEDAKNKAMEYKIKIADEVDKIKETAASTPAPTPTPKPTVAPTPVPATKTTYEKIRDRLNTLKSNGTISSWGYIKKDGKTTGKQVEGDTSEILYFDAYVQSTRPDNLGKVATVKYRFIHVDGPWFVMRRPFVLKSSEVENWESWRDYTIDIWKETTSDGSFGLYLENDKRGTEIGTKVDNFLSKYKNLYGITDYSDNFRLICWLKLD